jgi:hypothetical protein
MFAWIFDLIVGALGGIFYVIFIYVPLWVLNIFYNLFKFLGSGFNQAIFHTQIINGRLIWQFN